MGNKGKRFNEEDRKIKPTKIISVIIFFVVLAMVILGIKKILNTKVNTTGKISTMNYFSLFSDGKWGVIDSNGEILIEPQYDEMLIIPNNSKPYFICTYNINYETGEYNTKIINEKNQDIINEYDKVNFIDYYDENGQLVFLDNLLKVEKDGKVGLISLNGNEILNCKYEDISLLSGVDNSIIVKENGLYGLCDYKGNSIIETEYIEIKRIGNNYKNGYIIVNQDNLYGIIDFNSDIILENKYLDIKPVYSSNKYAVKIDNKYKIIDKTEKVILEQEFEDIKDINSNEIIYKSNNMYGVINTEGEIKITPQYEDLDFLENNTYIAKQNGKYGIINSNNETEIDYKYTEINYISSAGIIICKISNNQYDLYDKTNMELRLTVNSFKINESYITVKINDDIKYYNFKFEEKNAKDVLINNTVFSDKKNEKYGFIDSNSNIIVEYKYDEVTEYNEYGFAGIKLNGLWGVVDINGNIVVSPKYNLDNNKEINFIGKWHIGIDSTYYTDM